VAELDVGGRFGGVVTRVRRGDLDLLARDDLHVLLGDRLRVVVPRGRMGELSRYLGDTERRVSEVDAVSLGLGLTLGFLLGLLSLPLGSVALSLWSLPTGASLTLRQLGVLVFLAAVGLSSGPAPADALGEPVGRKLLLTGALLAVLGPVLMTLLTHRLGMSPARSGGLIAGFVGNPSLLAFATSRAADERVNEGYATLFAIDTILKVLLVQVIVGVG
jgi:putative transport protein